MGPLFTKILADQFTRLRSGDRFFYLNESWTADEMSLFQQGNTLARVIEANTSITNLQSDVFLFQASISGTVFRGGPRNTQLQGAAGITVHLEDSSGDVLATAVTDSRGRYSFNQLSGPAANPVNGSGVSATGTYNVVLVLPSGARLTSPAPGSVLISRGGLNVTGVNFTISSDGHGSSSGGWNGSQGSGSGGKQFAAVQLDAGTGATTTQVSDRGARDTGSTASTPTAVTPATTVTLPSADVALQARHTAAALIGDDQSTDDLSQRS
jgi:hypothetical protein